MPEVVDNFGVESPQAPDVFRGAGFVPLPERLENPFQGVGGLAHGRDDDKELPLLPDDPAQVAHARRIADRGSAEFIDFHSVCPTAAGYFLTGLYFVSVFQNRKA